MRPAVADKYLAAPDLPSRLLTVVVGDVHCVKRENDGRRSAGRDHGRLREGAELRFTASDSVAKPAHDDIRAGHPARVLDRHGNLDRSAQRAFDLCGDELERRVGKSVSERIAHHLRTVFVAAAGQKVEEPVANKQLFRIRDLRSLPAAGRRVVAIALRPRVDGPAGRIHLPRQDVRDRVARRLAEERDEHKRLDRVLVHERRIEHTRRVQEDNDAVERGAGVGEKPLLLGVQTPSAGRLRDVRRLARAASDHDDALLRALALGELRERVMGAFRFVEAPRPLVPVAV